MDAPPERPGSGPTLDRLRKRRDFLFAAKARNWAAPGFVLQARRRRESEIGVPPQLIRIGYTASKKVGNAVLRNRAKRRLRALAEPDLASLGRPGWDYVLIARAGQTAARPFQTMRDELREAVMRVHSDEGHRSDRRGERRGKDRGNSRKAREK